ncbi:MAG: immune inhibitor A [Clostridia bacterium]|nr:immune inhibitor A [Clostridia bacterium]
MKKFFVLLLALCLTIPSFGAVQISEETLVANNSDTYVIEHELAPMNFEAYIDMFIKEGKLPENPTQQQISDVMKAEFGNMKFDVKQSKEDKIRMANAEKAIKEKISNSTNLNNSSGKSKDLPILEESQTHEVIKEVKVLALLIEFPDYPHNSIVPNSPKSYHTNDFSVEHYQNLLFGEDLYTTPEGVTSQTMTTYYDGQSNGHFRVTGDVFGWYTAENPAAYYGYDVNSVRGDDIAPRNLVVEALNAAIAAGVDLSVYDNYNNATFEPTPDGIVDHLMVLHAGLGQEEGGGALGTDAIWSHSWDLNDELKSNIDGNIIASNYTIEPENGAIGVMVHEFAHDLGIPDDYDTQYTGDGDIVEAWSLMASGSWTGDVGGTEPVGINPWGRLYLAFFHTGLNNPWQNYAWVDYGVTGTLNLATASYKTDAMQSLIIELPPQETKLLTPTEGQQTFWGGSDSELDSTLDYSLTLTEGNQAVLSYDIWYDIEEDWDAGFIQISVDGSEFQSISTPLTRTFENPDGYPTIMNSLPGYTGSSNGWQKETIDLSSYSGEITLRFRYATDWGTENPGMFVDNINITDGETVILNDGAEDGFANFVNNGWEQNTGSSYASHRYVAEWRSHLNADAGLLSVGGANFDYNQGMLLWYVNDAYAENWVGVHPGFGRIGVVDATQFVYMNQGLGNGNEYGSTAGYMPFIQMKDAAFSTDKSANTDLSYYSWAQTPNLPGKHGNSLFDDSKSYIDFRNPFGGLFVPNYGLQIKVLGESEDYSQGLIQVNIK